MYDVNVPQSRAMRIAFSELTIEQIAHLDCRASMAFATLSLRGRHFGMEETAEYLETVSRGRR
jgi:hypothetical protein